MGGGEEDCGNAASGDLWGAATGDMPPTDTGTVHTIAATRLGREWIIRGDAMFREERKQKAAIVKAFLSRVSAAESLSSLPLSRIVFK